MVRTPANETGNRRDRHRQTAEHKRVSPDDGLSSANNLALNQNFYAGDPADYLTRRLKSLLVAATEPELLESVVNRGVSIGSLSIAPAKVGSILHVATSAIEQDRQRFLIADSQVLLHHSAETLLRLYVAHAAMPPVPWLSLARVHSPREFKQTVERDVAKGGAKARRAIAKVFYGSTSPAGLSPPYPDPRTWVRGTRNIEFLLRSFAQSFLSDSHLYNASKHGLAIQPGRHGLKIDDGSVVNFSGDAVEYLQVVESDGRPRWAITTKFVQIDRSLALVHMATVLIDQLWRIGKMRYLGVNAGPIGIYETWLPRIIVGGASGISVDQMTMPLLYDIASPDGIDGAGLT